MLSNLAQQTARLRPFAAQMRAFSAASGFNSPGNSSTSEEMKDAVKPEAVAANEQATQMHQFSEKQRFDKQRFDNAQEAVGAAAAPSDTFSSGKGGGAAEGTADEVLERRVTDPDTGGIAS
ncbi:hypothetical protein ACK3TF_000097 [Chlorella vulgaris]